MQADVVLDTHYFSAGSTTYDLFSYDQPIVTWPGIWNIGRYTLACYRKMGMTDLVANNSQEYAALAHRIATDRAWQGALRAAIRQRTPQLFQDAQAIAEHQAFFLDAVGRL